MCMISSFVEKEKVMNKNIHALRMGALTVELTLVLVLLFTVPSFADETNQKTVQAGSTVRASLNTGYAVMNSSSQTETTFVLKAKVTGLLAAGFSNIDDGTVTVYSSSGKQISRPLDVSSLSSAAAYKKVLYFGARQGTTYRVKISRVTSGEGVNYYATEFVNIAYGNRSGSSQSKAAAVKRNKVYSAVLPAGSSSSRWMKVRLKKGTCKILVQGLVDNSMYVRCTVAGGVLKNNQSILINRSYNDDGHSRYLKYSIYKPCTMYIRISRPQTYTSGVVLLKVNQ